MLWFHILIFLASWAIFYFLSSEILIDALIKIAHYLRWREFVVAFFFIAFASSFPNLFVGVFSAFKDLPQLSFGEILSGNVFDLTIAIGLSALIAKDGLLAQSKTIQVSSLFTLLAALLPLFLISDGSLSRSDGILLILFFILYFSWLFKKEDRYRKIYEEKETPPSLKEFFKASFKLFFGILLLILASKGIVSSSIYFAQLLNLPISLIGILIVGIGNALPETYFALVSAKRKENWIVLGDLMGSVIVPSSLVLGTVALITPIKISPSLPLTLARIFLVFSAIFFFFFSRTGRKITKKEGIFLIFLFLLFFFLEIKLAFF